MPAAAAGPFGEVCLGLRLMHRARGVFRRRVDRDEAQRAVTRVAEVVAHPRPNEHQIVGADLAGLPFQFRFASPVDE